MAEMRFAISDKTDDIVKEIAEKFGFDKAEFGRVALAEYLMRFDYAGRE